MREFEEKTVSRLRTEICRRIEFADAGLAADRDMVSAAKDALLEIPLANLQELRSIKSRIDAQSGKAGR